ncbi:unnamed protein product [Owenia fusiformis]|uniref:Uncharacterized protein n=1 Tax=Owenia fusiformis TaxID=6347 RepID=A0A8J1TT47_OWEFU|nr:unnamed protein product [Owenia fusiformis]
MGHCMSKRKHMDTYICEDMHQAIKRGHAECLVIQIETGDPINEVNDDGLTPLDVALKYSNMKCIEELLKACAKSGLDLIYDNINADVEPDEPAKYNHKDNNDNVVLPSVSVTYVELLASNYFRLSSTGGNNGLMMAMDTISRQTISGRYKKDMIYNEYWNL